MLDILLDLKTLVIRLKSLFMILMMKVMKTVIIQLIIPLTLIPILF